MKRKDFENAFYDDFSCFSLAAPARKSRRLDCELPPIIEEESGSGVPMVTDQGFLHESVFAGAAIPPNETVPVKPVVVSNDPPSQQLAIVLYNPENAASQGLVKSPSSSNLTFVMSPELLSGWESHMLHQGNQSRLTITELDEGSGEYNSFQSNNSMAVVPWVASQHQPYVTDPDSQHQPYVTDPDSQAPVMSVEPMEAVADCEMMEFDYNTNVPGSNNHCYTMYNGRMGGVQTSLPLQQPHCLMPQQYMPNTYTPVPW